MSWRWWAAIAAAVALITAGAVAVVVTGPRATVQTCVEEIIAHPDETAPGPGCKGLTHDQLVQATIQAMQQGATAPG